MPGWFQAVLTLYDARATSWPTPTTYRFHPDPVLYCEIPGDGQYMLEIRDSLYRGREDFVYRIAVGRVPVRDRASSRWAAGPGRRPRSRRPGLEPADKRTCADVHEPGVHPLSVNRLTTPAARERKMMLLALPIHGAIAESIASTS